MFSLEELTLIFMFVEGFLYGKIVSVLCALTCTLAKEVQLELFPGLLGIYSGIFVLYLQTHVSKETRTTSLIFYALCLLYVLSTATVVSDLLQYLIDVSNNFICKNVIFFISYADTSQYTTGSTSN